MTTECDHVVGWNGKYSDDWGPENVSEMRPTTKHGLIFRPDSEFEFCPECGTSLEEFWKPIRYP